MAATPGSSVTGGSAGAISYRDKAVKAHGAFWPEVLKVEPILPGIKSKFHELPQSHLTMRALVPMQQPLAACAARGL